MIYYIALSIIIFFSIFTLKNLWNIFVLTTSFNIKGVKVGQIWVTKEPFTKVCIMGYKVLKIENGKVQYLYNIKDER